MATRPSRRRASLPPLEIAGAICRDLRHALRGERLGAFAKLVARALSSRAYDAAIEHVLSHPELQVVT